ncbi:MAG: hypothetical protein AVDCRST_MAG18-1030, partial [uncultured Thermomicrobiales bacterium]
AAPHDRRRAQRRAPRRLVRRAPPCGHPPFASGHLMGM